MRQAVGLLLILWGSAFAASPDPLHKGIFVHRACAGLVSAFLHKHPPVVGTRKRIVPRHVRETAVVTLTQLRRSLGYFWDAAENPSIYVTRKTWTSMNEDMVGERLGSMRNAAMDERVLVDVIDGHDAIEAFAGQFLSETRTFVEKTQSPAQFSKDLWEGYRGIGLLLSAATLGLIELNAPQASPVAVWAAAGAFFQGMLLPWDLPFRFLYLRDKTPLQGPVLPRLFDETKKILANTKDAPQWVMWGENGRFSTETIDELWDPGMQDWIPPEMVRSFNNDDERNALSPVAYVMHLWDVWRLKKKDPQKYQRELARLTKPVLVDYVLIKAGTLGLKEPRLIVELRIPEGVNDRDDDGGFEEVAEPTPDPSEREPVLSH